MLVLVKFYGFYVCVVVKCYGVGFYVMFNIWMFKYINEFKKIIFKEIIYIYKKKEGYN